MKNSSLSVKGNIYRILLAPNAFKGSLTAEDFCRICVEELPFPFVPVSMPMCDGGDGSAAIIAAYLKALPRQVVACDALGRRKTVTYYIQSDTAILDLAGVCGLKDLHPSEYNVLQANTAGLGQVLKQIARQNICRIILGVGGSASIDGGTGALTEMGLKINRPSLHYRNALIDLQTIEADQIKENFKDIEWLILCDVNNPLTGPQGAAKVFGPQKGATLMQTELLDQQLKHYGQLLTAISGKELLSLPHGGAAGGIAAAFYALFGAQLISGAEYCMELSGFYEQVPLATLVITGEGCLDSQSIQGKLPGMISSFCHKARIPVVAIAGSAIAPFPPYKHLYTLLEYAGNLQEAISNPEPYLRMILRNLKKDILNIL